MPVSAVPPATASAADVSRTGFTNRDDRNKSGQSQDQCTPMPLPALGTQRIIHGNGTNLGTVISLQCPAKHRLIGSELMCVMGINSTHWVGETYCKPMSSYEDYGFRMAVLASIISSAIIFFMSMAFITCCLVDCIKEDKRKKQARESDVCQWEEQEDNRSRYSHKGRNNNNNNNTQEKGLSLWGTGNPAMCDSVRDCRCHQQYAYAPACTYGPTPPLPALPGHDYNQPLLPRNPESMQLSGPPPQCFEPPQPLRHTTSPSLVQISAVGPGLVWQYGGQQSSLSRVNPSTTDESNTRNINSPKEFSIRIISV